MTEEKHLLILGTSEIARALADMARQLPWASLTVAETGVREKLEDQSGLTLIDKTWPDAPWTLASGTHVVISRGHDRDPISVETALAAGAEHVYLIASARRAVNLMESMGMGTEDSRLQRLSAPCGLDLGGQSSGAIALSILAEVQWRAMGTAGSLRPVTEARNERAARSSTGQRFDHCPGQRD